MPTLFDPAARDAILHRLSRLEANAPRQWGKMDPAQALAHCASAFEMATADSPLGQKLIGKLLAPFFRGLALGDRPFGRNSPTDARLVVSDQRDLVRERERLQSLVDRFCRLGPAGAGQRVHVFFGRLTGAEWGVLMWKHLDHHLRQFGA